MDMLDVNNTIFSIGNFEVTFYGLFMALGMAFGLLVACLNAKKRGLKATDILIVTCYILPLAVIGAKIYYVLFSLDEYPTFASVFENFGNGFAIYGGVIGGALGILLYSLIHKKNFFAVADIAVVSLILGQAIGRIGCYFGGCCYGIVVADPSQQWFPFATFEHGAWHYSTFFYEALWNIIFFAVLMLFLYLGKFIKEYGVITALYFIFYGIGRAMIEGIRGDSLAIGSHRISQILSIILVVVGAIAIVTIYVCKYAFKKPLKFLEFKQKDDNLAKNDENLSKNGQK